MEMEFISLLFNCSQEQNQDHRSPEKNSLLTSEGERSPDALYHLHPTAVGDKLANEC